MNADPVRRARTRRRYWIAGGAVALVAVVGSSIGAAVSLSGGSPRRGALPPVAATSVPHQATSVPPRGPSVPHRVTVPAADGSCADPGTATPMVFVHGLNGSPADFTDGGTPSLASTLTALPSVAATYFDYHSYGADWVTDPHIGPALARDIACLGDTSAANGGPGKVVVVAHSMGGLALRYAAVQLVGGRAVATRIGLAVTVAAPNTGSWIDGMVTSTARGVGSHLGSSDAAANQIVAIARSVCAPSSGQRPSGAAAAIGALCGLVLSPDSPAGQALIPGSPQLAALAVLPASVPLFAVAGDIQLTTGPLSFGRVTLPVALPIPVDIGDSLVRPQSALAEADHSGPFSGSYTDSCTERLVTLGSVAGLGSASCAHGSLLHSAPVTAAVTTDVSRYLTTAANG